MAKKPQTRDAEDDPDFGAEIDALTERVGALESQTAYLTGRLSAAESQVAEQAERIDAIESKLDAPTPPPESGGDGDDIADRVAKLEERNR